MTGVLVAMAALFGLLIGSFLNVVIARVPAGESIVSPGSRCGACGTPILPRDNIPVVSWLLLKRRCRACQAPISARYPAVELLTAGLFAAVAARFGWAAELPAYLYLTSIGVALAFIDLDVRRLPDAIVLPSYPVMGVLLTIAAAATGDWDDLLRAALGGLILGGFYFALVFAYPAGMGFGDVKLSGVLGMALGYLGWAELGVGAFLGFLYGGVIGVVLLAVGKAGRKSAIPFGPFMLLGALTAVLFGGGIADAYSDLLL